MDAAERPIALSTHERVCTVTLNQPKRLNAADAALHGALATVRPDIAADEQVRAVVLTGAGRAFSAGDDLGLLQDMVEDERERSRVLAEAATIVSSMLDVPQPIVAAVNGPAVGLGCSLVSLCDLVVAGRSAYFSDPHVDLGLVASDGAALTWPLNTGQRTKEFVLLGGQLSAEEAHASGVVNGVVADDACVEEAMAVARQRAALPPQAVRETKRVPNAPLRERVERCIEDALKSEHASFDTPEPQANLHALRERDGAR